MKNIKEVKRIIKVAQVFSMALFTMLDATFAFGFQTYNHNITIQQNPGQWDTSQIGRAMGEGAKMMYEAQQQANQQQFQMQLQRQQQEHQQRLLNQQEHLQRLRSDPEYAYRNKLIQKDNALGKVINESINTINAFYEKAVILSEEVSLLLAKMKIILDDKKYEAIFNRLSVLRNKEKALDTSKLLPKEQDEIRNFRTKSDELIAKMVTVANKEKADNQKVLLVNQSVDKNRDFEKINQKYFTEAQKYQHKIEYDNKAYEAYLNIHEKRAEVLLNWAREAESYYLILGERYEGLNKLLQEEIELRKETLKYKSFVKKYEKFFSKVEKRLGV